MQLGIVIILVRFRRECIYADEMFHGASRKGASKLGIVVWPKKGVSIVCGPAGMIGKRSVVTLYGYQSRVGA